MVAAADDAADDGNDAVAAAAARRDGVATDDLAAIEAVAEVGFPEVRNVVDAAVAAWCGNAAVVVVVEVVVVAVANERAGEVAAAGDSDNMGDLAAAENTGSGPPGLLSCVASRACSRPPATKQPHCCPVGLPTAAGSRKFGRRETCCESPQRY